MTPNRLRMIADYLEKCIPQDDVSGGYAKELRRYAKDIERSVLAGHSEEEEVTE
jgi:hypothetical protein